MVDRENGIPYYRQLMSSIQQQIEAGFYKEGQQIPTEMEMSRANQVNRHTIRQAIDELCRIGVLYRLKGKGTFVAKAPLDSIEYQLSTKNRFTENIMQAGKVPSNKVFRAVEMIAPTVVKEALALGADESVYCIHVLRFVNGKPFLLSQVFLPAKYFPGLFDRISDFQTLSLLIEQYGINPRRVKSTLRASFPSQEEALALEIPSNMPVIKVENVLKSQDDILIEYNLSCYRGDLAKLSIAW
ncbi:putative transcriptional regulator PhnF [Sporomusa silvacetica DSM 10669]|uniref:Transcriptional regulator PhnF n=1 Tax=Sporomusa silvacetica DSM 10669 TaxID=1123289 RepID=A0ABZ3ISK9_9FIRM|nr:GntR family transcriptional regulator [Sporomusa silvacetica]OZC20849.1 putative transcriptional regulator PhnF [Sporomusa silvacetica DSM 10669]